MKILTEEQVQALLAFLDAFDLTTTGAWSGIETCMIEAYGIENPEEAMEDVRKALQNG